MSYADKSDRPQINEEEMDVVLERVKLEWLRRLQQKGFGVFASRHESLGVIVEEYHELCDAVRGAEYKGELYDCAVAILHAIATVNFTEE